MPTTGRERARQHGRGFGLGHAMARQPNSAEVVLPRSASYGWPRTLIITAGHWLDAGLGHWLGHWAREDEVALLGLGHLCGHRGAFASSLLVWPERSGGVLAAKKVSARAGPPYLWAGSLSWAPSWRWRSSAASRRRRILARTGLVRRPAHHRSGKTAASTTSTTTHQMAIDHLLSEVVVSPADGATRQKLSTVVTLLAAPDGWQTCTSRRVRTPPCCGQVQLRREECGRRARSGPDHVHSQLRGERRYRAEGAGWESFATAAAPQSVTTSVFPSRAFPSAWASHRFHLLSARGHLCRQQPYFPACTSP